MGLIIAYIILVLCGIFCIWFTISEHKKRVQKDIDTELYNQNLKTAKQYLEKETADLNKNIEDQLATREQIINSNKQIFKENEQLIIQKENLIYELNELNNQQHKSKLELKENETKNEVLMAQMATLTQTMDNTMRDQQSLARKAFTAYCDALDAEYTQKEKEYDDLVAILGDIFESEQDAFLQRMAEHDRNLDQRKQEMQRDLDTIRIELDKIRATRAAAMEAQLREQEIKDKATFYTLQLNDADKRDVAYLQSIEYNLREARPLRMLIWSTFYRDKVNDLAARAGALGASGIYKITHIDSGISYIGQAKDIKERWVTHVKCSLGIDTPVTSQLYAFTREKGIDNFTFEVLEKCSLSELNEKEKFYIDLYQTYDFGLNSTKGNK